MQFSRKDRHWRHGQKCEITVNLVWCLKNKIAVKAKQLFGILDVPKHRSTLHDPRVLQVKKEGSNDSKIAASSTDRPKKVGVFLFTGRDKLAIREHYICFNEAVNSKPVFPREVAQPAA